jgi:outer membrane immunogenic protein
MATAAAFAVTATTASADGGFHGGVKDTPAPFSWTGFYIGATAGGGWGESRFDDGSRSNPFDIDGFIAGGTIGYNFQFDRRWVVGIEADMSFSDISGSFGPGNLGQPNGSSWNCGSGPCRTDVDWFGTVRGRIGSTFGQSLLYATGGLAFGKVKSGIDNTTSFQSSDTNVGWTVGAGIEHSFSNNWSAKIEYLHVDLGWTATSNGFFKSDAEFDVVRAGLNYRFGR